RRKFFARRLPKFLAGLDVVSSNEGILLNVSLHDHHVLVDNWGAAVFPLVIDIIEPAGVEHAEIFFPQKLAIEIVSVETFGAEVNDQVFSVGGWCRSCVCRLRMPLNFRNALVRESLPEDLARSLVESINLPCMLRIVFDRRDVAEETEACLIFAARDGAHHEYFVAPNDGACVRETGDRSFPTDVF